MKHKHREVKKTMSALNFFDLFSIFNDNNSTISYKIDIWNVRNVGVKIKLKTAILLFVFKEMVNSTSKTSTNVSRATISRQ